jgi:hypothetical protein
VLIIEKISIKRHIAPANRKEINFILSDLDSILIFLGPGKKITNTSLIRKCCILRKDKILPRIQLASTLSRKAIGHINPLEIKKDKIICTLCRGA